MSEEIRNKLVPKLRFPEFQNAADWLCTTIGEVGTFYYGKSAPKWSLFSDAPTLCVRYGELYTKFDTIISKVLSRTNIDSSNLRFSKGGEILIPRVGEVPQDFAKNCCYLPFSNIAIGEMISVYETKEYPIFYAYYFRTLWKQFAEVVEGQNVKNLYYFNLEPIVVGKPSFLEQQKIADCLSSLDDLITAQKQKLEALKTHKKGLMQQLFPAEGETVPKLRFAEFRESGDWVKKKLGDIGKFTGGGTPSRMNEEFWKGDIPWISSSDLHEDSIYSIKINRFITKEALQGSATKLVPKNSILLVSRVGVGKLAISKNTVCTSQDFTNLTPANDNLIFLAYYLKFNSKVLLSFSQGMAIMGFTKDDISNLELLLPTNKEQQKIADCLSSLDELIAAQTEKIEALKQHKKGLMQQLFPIFTL